MKRLWTDEPLNLGSTIQLSQEESKHLYVLRSKPGDQFLLTNGKECARAEVTVCTFKESAQLLIKELLPIDPPLKIEIVQALLKGPKMDWLVEKLTELGVAAIHPVTTERSVAEGDKQERWQRIIKSAVKQSGNTSFPQMHSLRSLQEKWQALSPLATQCILLNPQATSGLAQILQKHDPQKHLFLFLGPEGGFSPKEEEMMRAAGAIEAKLSRNILRGETAAIAAAAIAAHIIDF